MASFWRGASGVSAIQQIIASTSWVTLGALWGRQIMSPREIRPKTALISDELGALDHLGTFTVTGAADAPMRRLVMQAQATQTAAPGGQGMQAPGAVTRVAKPRQEPGEGR